MQEPLVLPHFSFLFHSFSVYKSAHDSGLHLLSYNTVIISCTIIRTFPELPGDKPIHLVLIQILGTDIVLIILIIFVIHTVFAAGTGTFLLFIHTLSQSCLCFCIQEYECSRHSLFTQLTITLTAANIHRLHGKNRDSVQTARIEL